MTLLRAAVVPSAPLLVPALAAGGADVDAELRRGVLGAVRAAVDGVRRVTVVGDAPGTGPRHGTWDWSGFGVHRRGAEAEPLPLALAMGEWFLDAVGYTGERVHLGVDARLTPAACTALGEDAARGPDTAMLVVGDGSARRSEKAPGYLDPRAEPFDERVAAALAAADAGALLDLDEALGRELLAAGRAGWQVLAGASAGRAWRGELLAHSAPYGVAYLVARWEPV